MISNYEAQISRFHSIYAIKSHKHTDRSRIIIYSKQKHSQTEHELENQISNAINSKNKWTTPTIENQNENRERVNEVSVHTIFCSKNSKEMRDDKTK